MKVALVHDYLNEFGGAERVLLALSEIWPEAPIYTVFMRKGSAAAEQFKGKEVKTSWAQKVPGFDRWFYSPLRFLAPKIWGSLEKKLQDYDVVISSASWYVTKGFGSRKMQRKNPLEFCYCHTPPRWLYGYRTSVEWQRFWLVRVYGLLVGHFMRLYDFQQAQKVNYFIANSQEVQGRIAKFYRRKARVIYPPVELRRGKKFKRQDYYLVISRIVGGKGLELTIKAAAKMGFKLKIAGEGAGWGGVEKRLRKLAGNKVEWLGKVDDEELVRLYSQAKGFLAVAEAEDFGMTPVEAMSCGTAVVAFRGGGYRESLVENKTGVFFDDYSVEGLIKAIKRFEKTTFKPSDCLKQAEKFSKDRFKREIKKLIEEKTM